MRAPRRPGASGARNRDQGAVKAIEAACRLTIPAVRCSIEPHQPWPTTGHSSVCAWRIASAHGQLEWPAPRAVQRRRRGPPGPPQQCRNGCRDSPPTCLLPNKTQEIPALGAELRASHPNLPIHPLRPDPVQTRPIPARCLLEIVQQFVDPIGAAGGARDVSVDAGPEDLFLVVDGVALNTMSGSATIWALGRGRPAGRPGPARSPEGGSPGIPLGNGYCGIGLGPILALYWYCAGTALAPHKYVTGAAMAISWYCAGIALLRCQAYRGATPASHGYCTGTALVVLHSHCAGTGTDTAMVLRCHCACTVPVLHECFASTAGVLHPYRMGTRRGTASVLN